MTGGDVYNYKVVRQFALASVVWGIVGMLVGVFIAAELASIAGGSLKSATALVEA